MRNKGPLDASYSICLLSWEYEVILRETKQTLRAAFSFARQRLHVDRMISLGGRCEVAFQLRRIGTTDRAYPFDWWIMPLEALPRILAGGISSVFDASQLHKVPDYGGRAGIYSNHAGTIHLHEFAHDEDGLALSIAEISERLGNKYEALYGRMVDDAAQGRTLFVRQYLDGHDPRTAGELEPLIDDLEFGLMRMTEDYLLLLIGYCRIGPRPRVLQSELGLNHAKGLGSNWSWTSMMRANGISCRRGPRSDSNDLFRTLPGSGAKPER